MTDAPTLTAVEITEIGEAIYGLVWRGEMARALGVPRQSIGYYLRTGGVNRTQAAAIIGLVARAVASELHAEETRRVGSAARQSVLSALLRRFDTLS